MGVRTRSVDAPKIYEHINRMLDERVTVDHPNVHAPGVFFDLPAADYHAALALSATGVRHLRISTLDWWTRCPVLNPDWRDEVTDAQVIGIAYHKRIVEGAEAFAASYAAELDPAEYPDALRTVADITAELERHLVRPRAKDLKADLIARLRELDPEVPVWDDIVRTHQLRHAGKTLLKPWLIAEIERAALRIETHPQLASAFRGGYPEVSVFWTDEETGIPCKARFDYLKPRAVIDLKSFDNIRGLPVRKAIVRAIANWRYHTQAAFYLEAAAAARRMSLLGGAFGTAEAEFLKAFCDSPESVFLFVFQQRRVQVVRGLTLPPGILLDLATAEIDEAKRTWARCWQQYGVKPWLDEEQISAIDDNEVPAWIAG